MKKIEKINFCSLCESKKIKTIDPKINMCKCLECGHFFINPRPSIDRIKKYYSESDNFEFWQSLEEGFDALSKRRVELIKRFRTKGDILDVGAGIGQLLFFAKNTFKIHGTEVSKIAIKIAKDKYKMKLTEGDLEEINFKNQKYDIITMFHVLEHVHNPGKQIKICKNLLNKKGILAVAVPNDVHGFLKLPLKRLFRFLKLGQYKHYGKFGMAKIEIDQSMGEIHLSQFTAPVLVKFFEENGVRILFNSLDPYYVPDNFKNRAKYNFFKFLKSITNKNYYDTILIVAEKLE